MSVGGQIKCVTLKGCEFRTIVGKKKKKESCEIILCKTKSKNLSNGFGGKKISRVVQIFGDTSKIFSIR